MPFEVPTKPFDAIEHAKNKVLRANQLEELILQQFKANYEDFWGVNGSDKTETIDKEQVTTFVGGGSRYSVEEMQSMGAASGLTQFILAAYPESLPPRYQAAAFDYKVDGGRIVLTQLSDAWSTPKKGRR